MVFDAASLSGRWIDHRGFRESFEFAAAKGNSYRDQERNARGGNDLRGVVRRRYFGGEAVGLFGEAGCELDQDGIVRSAEFPPGLSAWIVGGLGAIGGPVCFGRTRFYRSNARQSR